MWVNNSIKSSPLPLTALSFTLRSVNFRFHFNYFLCQLASHRSSQFGPKFKLNFSYKTIRPVGPFLSPNGLNI